MHHDGHKIKELKFAAQLTQETLWGVAFCNLSSHRKFMQANADTHLAKDQTGTTDRLCVQGKEGHSVSCMHAGWSTHKDLMVEAIDQ